jgi:hypothetical protein
MEITGKVHCFFEQSGTFKNEFIKLGIPAEDYDIQNNFGQTDHVVDLFQAIEDAYDNKPSLFDEIRGGDLIMAFFPCIYFSCMSQMDLSWSAKNYRRLSGREATNKILERVSNRERYFTLLIKMCQIVRERGLRMIFENPYSLQTFLKSGFLLPPAVIDNNRTLRGDCFVKPTAYWFINSKPTNGESFQKPKEIKRLMWENKSPQAGVCSEERSMISPDYARNFICDFIIGKAQPHTLTTLF